MCRHISPMRIYPKNKTKQCKIHSTSAHISWATIKQEQYMIHVWKMQERIKENTLDYTLYKLSTSDLMTIYQYNQLLLPFSL